MRDEGAKRGNEMWKKINGGGNKKN